LKLGIHNLVFLAARSATQLQWSCTRWWLERHAGVYLREPCDNLS